MLMPRRCADLRLLETPHTPILGHWKRASRQVRHLIFWFSQ